ncbi:MAG: metallo-beta-lactamase [Chitinophagaceae bacterium]|nr:metallo-beta-lactamase [Chitinophagaceae bacterium]
MKIGFHGGARQVTGSKHLLTLDNGTNILLDCGLFQGMGDQTDDFNNNFGFNPAEINVLLLSHAHIDHCGLIPKLVKEGFKGKIFCTPATMELAGILLHDSAEIQTYETDHINEKRAEKSLPLYEPLYTPDDVAEAISLFQTFEYNEWFEPVPGVKAMFSNTGHLVGASAINLIVTENGKETTITFSGDVGRYRSVLLQPPGEFPQPDYLILESTYGDKHHDLLFNHIDEFLKWIKKVCIERKGKLIIPAFSVGRTQEVLYALNQLELEKRLPENLLFFVDSPLSLKATQTIKKYTNCFNERLQEVLKIDSDPFEFKGLKYVETVDQSKQLKEYEEPCVIISASGTADAGRVRHHIQGCIEDEKNCVLLVGYCGANSLGGQLLNGVKEVDLLGAPRTVAAEIGQLKSMSAHGDVDDLTRFIEHLDPAKTKKIFLVHGEYLAQQALAAKLNLKEFKDVIIPAQREEYEL